MQEPEGCVFREGAKMQLEVPFCGEALLVSLVWAEIRESQVYLIELGAGVYWHLVASINTRRCPGDTDPLAAVRAVHSLASPALSTTTPYYARPHLARHPYLAATCHFSFAVPTGSATMSPAPIAMGNATVRITCFASPPDSRPF